jgi:hypothetical protein
MIIRADRRPRTIYGRPRLAHASISGARRQPHSRAALLLSKDVPFGVTDLISINGNSAQVGIKRIKVL